MPRAVRVRACARIYSPTTVLLIDIPIDPYIHAVDFARKTTTIHHPKVFYLKFHHSLY